MIFNYNPTTAINSISLLEKDAQVKMFQKEHDYGKQDIIIIDQDGD